MNKATCAALSFILALALWSCKKESFITGKDAVVSISDDSLHFDTVFTSTGSVTKFIKIYNENDRKLLISRIGLAGGPTSFFKMNADGMQGPDVSNVEMAANDSLYIFVTVKIDPTTDDMPFVIEDSIIIEFNGKVEKLQLQAWGQNATFMRSAEIKSDELWTNKKPYVIIGGLTINEGATLSIAKGTRIYLHADAPIFVDGSLVAAGEKYDSTRIVFTGDRLDDPYRGFPASWPGIYFRERSKGNLLSYVVVKNAYQGIVADRPSTDNSSKVKLEQCVIDNCYDAGIMGVNSSIEAVNCLVSNCGKNILLVKGGNYVFSQCTDVAYSNEFIAHKQPVLGVTNYLKEGNNILSAPLTASFVNSIFWGDNGIVNDEVVLAKDASANFSAVFTNCIWKVTTAPPEATANGIIENIDPLFNSIDTRKAQYNFRLQNGSPAIAAGATSGIPLDLDGTPRDPNFPDIGAYESAF